MEKRIPVTVIDDVSKTDKIMKALKAYGIFTAEITFRTDCAAEAISLSRRLHPDMCIGAGTVINAETCEAAIGAGAQFIVSPGFSAAVAAVCRERGITYYPGCATPTEIMTALDAGFSVLKFFPADVYGGEKALSAFRSVFPQVRFIPTGGVNAYNEARYLSLPNVAAVGGTYLVADALKNYGGQV
ncbi:MAG: bifunctional 4-hydroxy-2-oxoglutarate aldolase/2-dehydro-3-deoxy-phosphogluconate aldolase [Clostridia bacterium]|nr:bifunctional 4-hydroxy-2-oxoglutarate aldolase/2-dehydro-3-deoxy-phosphogluconate aldolase [Clostridia bacterium]